MKKSGGGEKDLSDQMPGEDPEIDALAPGTIAKKRGFFVSLVIFQKRNNPFTGWGGGSNKKVEGAELLQKFSLA